MTSSYLGNKISDMKARFEAENEAIKNDSGASDSSPFGSRPGSVRRPKLCKLFLSYISPLMYCLIGPLCRLEF